MPRMGQGSRLERRGSRGVLVLVALATIARLVWAFATYGVDADILNTQIAVDALTDGNPFDLYPQINEGVAPAWPYPPGYLGWGLVADALAGPFGHFDGWLQVPPILADAAIALLVHRVLLRRGAQPRIALAGAALVALGPVFFLISGYTYQVDAVAALPVLVALVVWDGGHGRRWLLAGALIGLGATIKPPLGLLLLALLPSARNWREAIAVSAAAVAVPLASLAPFLAEDLSGTVAVFRDYHGLAGLAQLTAVIDPDLTRIWVQTRDYSDYANSADDLAPFLVAAIAAATLAAGFAFRPRALDLGVLFCLLLWAFGPGFHFQYLIWGLPLILASGRLWLAIGLQGLSLLPMLLLLTGAKGDRGLLLYRVDIYVLWAFTIAAAVLVALSLRRPAPSVPLFRDVGTPEAGVAR
jgi:hypothetical protein